MTWSPPIDARYWVALIMSSVLGTNTGDFVAEILKLGHVKGLVWLAVLLALIFVVDRATRSASPFYFWAAIIIVRTAATNVGDIFGDYGLSFAWSVPLTIVVYAALIGLYARTTTHRTIVVNALYWVTMMVAAILGTVGGDASSFGIGLWPLGTFIVFGALASGAILASAQRGLWTVPVVYWIIVGLVRTAGTGGGDALSQIGGIWMGRFGLGSTQVPYYINGLSPATIVSGIVFVTLIWMLYVSPRRERASVS